MPSLENLKTLRPELAEAFQRLFHVATLLGMTFGEKFIGIANHLLLHRLWRIVARWQWQVLAAYGLGGQTGARVALTDAGHSLVALCAHNFGAETAVEQVGRIAVAMDAGRIGLEYAQVVEHGSTFDKSLVKMQLGVTMSHLKSHVGYLATMQDEQSTQRIVGRIIFINNV